MIGKRTAEGALTGAVAGFSSVRGARGRHRRRRHRGRVERSRARAASPRRAPGRGARGRAGEVIGAAAAGEPGARRRDARGLRGPAAAGSSGITSPRRPRRASRTPSPGARGSRRRPVPRRLRPRHRGPHHKSRPARRKRTAEVHEHFAHLPTRLWKLLLAGGLVTWLIAAVVTEITDDTHPRADRDHRRQFHGPGHDGRVRALAPPRRLPDDRRGRARLPARGDTRPGGHRAAGDLPTAPPRTAPSSPSA